MIRWFCAFCLFPLPALADVPRVVTDIAPIHSLTAQVMGDLGQPDLLLPPGADPHDFALRPSDAGRLTDAALVIWVGESLTPWLAEPLATLAPQATLFSLLEVPGWQQLEVRDHKDEHDSHAQEHSKGHDAGHDDAHDHGHDDAHNDAHDHGHDDAHDHGHNDAHDDAHDHGHNEAHDGGHGHAHDHGAFDPHAWLDPTVAAVWVNAIAAQLGSADPANAPTYAANAVAAVERLKTLEQDISAELQGLSGRAYVLPHDGYQYFEARFGLTAQAAIAGIDARTPGPAQVAALRDQLARSNVVCVFSDAEIGDRWAALITEGTSANTANIDGVGRGLTAGPSLYGDMLARLADGFSQCLGSGT